MRANKIFALFFIAAMGIKSIEAVLSPEDEIFFGQTADRYDWTKHPCRRKCSNDEQPKICHYVFVVEQYSSMSKACYDCPYNMTDCFRPHCIATDGVQTHLTVVNRQLPGPLIEVCEGDMIIVDVRNLLQSQSITIHWHGFHQQGTPYMDGVPYVTQCPILPDTSFTYSFNASNVGTFFWHAHIGMLRSEGLNGPMVVKRRCGEYHAKLYDYDDHRMIIQDWMHQSGDDALMLLYQYKGGVAPVTILVNGRGRFQEFKTDNGTVIHTPPAVFEVEKNKRYRFRFIEAGFDECPIEVSIDNHTMTVISLDSNDIEPVEVDKMIFWPGERLDFVLNANQKSGNYWIRYRGIEQCINTQAHQVAILHYKDVELQDPKEPVGYDLPKSSPQTRTLNPHNSRTEVSPGVNIIIPNLMAVAENDVALKKKADQQVFLVLDQYKIDNYEIQRKGIYGYYQVPEASRSVTPQINHISLKLLDFPLLSQWDQLKPDSFCNSTHIPKKYKNCTLEQCICTHVIQVKLNSVVELVMIDGGVDAGIFNHPSHLHGHFFRVVAEENLDGLITIERFRQLDQEGKIKRRLDRAPLKDTTKTPDGGYTILRFHADNPGYWLFHCHFDMHNDVGMALVFKVGEHCDFPEKPKGFPTCASFEPYAM